MIDPNKQVLVVDDFATMRRIIIACLKEAGYKNVVEAEDGKKGYLVAENLADSITMIVSDWNMPNMDGLDMLRALKANPKTAHIPVLMVTAEAKKENIIAAAQAGASSYIVKPFTPETLADKIKKIQNSLQR
jgi:two-component system chemotaxis response regulator CheY